MAAYRIENSVELLCVAADYPDGIVAFGNAHRALHFHLQELVIDRPAWEEFVMLQRGESPHNKTPAALTLYTDLHSALGKNWDRVLHCAGCKLPLLDHPRGDIMSTPLFDRMAFALRALVNAQEQSRTVSSDTMKIAIGALNEYETGKLQDEEDAASTLDRIAADERAGA